MKHFYLLCITLFLSIQSVFAQKPYVMWGYCDNNITNKWDKETDKNVGAAIFVPTEVAQKYNGNLIKSLSVGFSSAAHDVTLFITKKLGEKAVIEKKGNNLKIGWNTINLGDTYTIDGEGFYVGYTAKEASAVGFSDLYDPNSCYTMKDGKWDDTTDPTKPAALNIKFKLEGKSLPMEMRMLNIQPVVTTVGEELHLKGKVESLSNQAVKSYELGYRINGQDFETVTIEANIAGNETHDFDVEVPAYQSGNYPMEIYIKSVNGETDVYAGNNSLATTYSSIDVNFEQRVVVEEGTASWCGNCPRGIEGFRAMNYKYPDTFIGITVHKDDKMSVKEYKPFFEKYFQGIPNAITNRDKSTICNPIFMNLEGIYKKEVKKRAIADVKVRTTVDADDQSVIKAEAIVRFAEDHNEADYRISFVLLENDVPGKQQNLGPVDFQEVSRAIYEFEGVIGSLPATIEKHKEYSYTYDMPVPTPEDINSKHPKLELNNSDMVAMLIDGKTGKIVNAAKVAIKVGETTTDITTDTTPSVLLYQQDGSICSTNTDDQIAVFTTTGARVENQNLEEGIYLVKVIRDADTLVQKFCVAR